MKSKSWVIIVVVIVVLIAIIMAIIGGFLLFGRKTKTETAKGSSLIDINNIKLDDTEFIQKREEIEEVFEKADVQFATIQSMIGESNVEDLTYEKLDEKFKLKFGENNYTLSGPDELGNFTVKVRLNTYTIKSNGVVEQH